MVQTWSHSDGDLNRDNVGHNADLWLDEHYLNVNRDDAWVNDGNEHYGHGLFLQNTMHLSDIF